MNPTIDSINSFMERSVELAKQKAERKKHPDAVKERCVNFKEGIIVRISLPDMSLSLYAKRMVGEAVRLVEDVLRLKEELNVEDVVWCNQLDLLYNPLGQEGFYKIIFKKPITEESLVS